MDGSSPSVVSRLARHGGQLGAAQVAYPHAPTPWLDLSTGINPQAYRAPSSTAAERARLPDPLRLLELERRAAHVFAVNDSNRVVATPGSEVALRSLPALIGATQISVAGPTYSSHSDAWSRALRTVRRTTTTEALAATQGVVVIVNPNNPDGAIVSREQLLATHDALRANDGWLIVDEAFVDVAPAISICDLAGTARAPRLVALRSFGKFFGLAGVRLGFAIGAVETTHRLRGLLGDWPLSAEALSAGLAAYADREWQRQMRMQLDEAARRLDDLLVRQAFTIVGGTSLFRLARHVDAAAIFEHLLGAGILTRPFDHDPQLLRFGLPGSSKSWRRLSAALESR